MTMTFSILTGSKTTTGSVKSWQNYGKIDSEGVLGDAEAMIYQTLRVQQMRASENLTVGAGRSSIDLPDGFLDPLRFRNITDDCDLTLVSEDELERRRAWTSGVLDTSDPAYWGIYDEAIQFDCKATTAFTGRMLYFKQPDALSTSNEQNWVTRRYPHLLRMACLAVAARFSHDDDMYQREERLFMATAEQINAQDELARRGQENRVID